MTLPQIIVILREAATDLRNGAEIWRDEPFADAFEAAASILEELNA